MLTQVIASTLCAVIAAGMLFQVAVVVRCGSRVIRARRRPARPAATVAPATMATAPRRRACRRDYRVALRTARLSVAA